MSGNYNPSVAPGNYVEWSAVEGLHWTEDLFFRERLYPLANDEPTLEVGTGGGRILFALSEKGFPSLSGIELCPRLTEHARKRAGEAGVDIRFEVGDACSLPLADASQGIVLALQQVLCLIEAPEDRKRAARELYRVLVPGGHLLASFLCWEERWYNPLVGAALWPVKIVRGEWNRLQTQYLCWLKLGFRWNIAYLFQRQPYLYWFRKHEMISLLRDAGFDVKMAVSYRKRWNARKGWMDSGPVIYVAAVKPGIEEP